MPLSELDPRARQKEQQIESFLQLWLRKFLPVLKETPTMHVAPDGGSVMSTDIHLYPVLQGSRMPVVSRESLFQRRIRSYRRDQGGPA